MKTQQEIRSQLEAAALEILYVSAPGKHGEHATRLSTVLGNKRDVTATAIIRRAEKRIAKSQHVQDKEAKASRMAAYREAAETESEIPYDVDVDRQYLAEMTLVRAWTARIPADELAEMVSADQIIEYLKDE